MTTAEWLEKNLAAAPPLSAAQVAVLRPVFAPVVPLMQRTAPATTEAARIARTHHQEGCNDQR